MKPAWIIAPGVVVAIGALWWSQQPRGPITVSGILEAHDIRVGSRIGGRVREVRVEEGARVSPGDELVILDPYDLNERLHEAEALLAGQRAALERLTTGFRVEEIAGARAARDRYRAAMDRALAGPRPLEKQVARDRVAVAEASLKKATADFERVRDLMERNNATAEEMNDVTRAIETAAAQAAEARDSLALLEEGTRAEDIAEATAQLAAAQADLDLHEAGQRREDVQQAEASVAAAESRVAAIRRQLEELTVTAPCECTVEAIELKPGDLIPANAPVVTLLDNAELWVRAYVPETLAGLKLGQELALRVDRFPGRRFSGRLTYIAREAEFTPSNAQTPEERSKQVYRVKVSLPEGQSDLRAGMTADVILRE